MDDGKFVESPESSGLVDPLTPLTILDRYIQDLQRCDEGARQLHVLLKAIGESLQAEAVFIQAVSGERVFESAGRYPLAPEGCRRLLQALLKESAGDDARLIQPNPGLSAGPGLPALASVAMVQLSKTKDTWAVALSFNSERQFQAVDLQLMVLARRLLATHSRQMRGAERLRETLLGLIHCLTAAIDAKDPYTCGHSERVARIAVRIGQEMRLPEAFLSDVYLAGLLHDIGKIGIKDAVLLKPGRLTEEETRIIQQHPEIGDRIVAAVPQLQHVRPGVRNHHERFDGAGYPDRLGGEQIPFMARILAVADSCDAMMSARPYRPPMPAPKLEAILRDGSGTQWDPNVVDHFTRCRQECYGICQRGIGNSVALAVDHAVRMQNDFSWKRSLTGGFLREQGVGSRE